MHSLSRSFTHTLAPFPSLFRWLHCCPSTALASSGELLPLLSSWSGLSNPIDHPLICWIERVFRFCEKKKIEIYIINEVPQGLHVCATPKQRTNLAYALNINNPYSNRSFSFVIPILFFFSLLEFASSVDVFYFVNKKRNKTEQKNERKKIQARLWEEEELSSHLLSYFQEIEMPFLRNTFCMLKKGMHACHIFLLVRCLAKAPVSQTLRS